MLSKKEKDTMRAIVAYLNALIYDNQAMPEFKFPTETIKPPAPPPPPADTRFKFMQANAKPFFEGLEKEFGHGKLIKVADNEKLRKLAYVHRISNPNVTLKEFEKRGLLSCLLEQDGNRRRLLGFELHQILKSIPNT